MKHSAFYFIAAAGLLFSSCRNGPGTASAGRGPVADTKNIQGSMLNIMIDNEVQALDPQKAVDGTSFEIVANFMDGLKQMAADGSVTNAVCKNETVSSDGLVYTFELRDDAFWSNGDPVTAQDFVFAWQRAIDPATASEYAYMVSDIAHIKNAVAIQAGQMNPDQLGVRALSSKKLEVQLTVPVSYFDQLLYFCTFYPINEKFYKKCGDKFGSGPDTVLSNGAFIITDYKEGADSFTLAKNTAYYDAKNVQLGGLSYHVIKNSEDGLKQYQSGSLDLIELAGSQVAQVKNSSEFKVVGSGYLWYVTGNMEKPEFTNLNMRLAVTFALNREAITENIIQDGSLPIYTAVPSEFSYNASGKDFTTSLKEFPDICSYDPAKAVSYFRKAQQELGKSRFTFKLVADDNETQQAVAAEIKSQIERTLPGITIELSIMKKSDRLAAMRSGNFDLGLTRWGPDYADPMTYLGMWVTGNDNNYGRWSYPSYDAIIADCTDGDLCTKLDERWTAMKKAERLVMEQAVIMPLYQQANADLIKSSVKGIAFHSVAVNRIYKAASKN